MTPAVTQAPAGKTTTAGRIAYLLAPMLVCLAVYWRAPFIWFRMDDFAWLGLPLEVQGFGLWHALFHPQAEGTVRVLSERVFFLALTSAFGLYAWPFRVVALATWFADLVLIQLIGARLTGSRAAGLLAAMLWTVSATLVLPLAWASSYNQVLCAGLILAAFYARLRWIDSGQRGRRESKWLGMEAVAYLLGFGALEVIVMYPLLVLLHASVSAEARAHWRSCLWMFVPAAAFTLAHLFFIPKSDSPVYQMFFDRRLVSDLYAYVLWTVGPSRMELVDAAWTQPGIIAAKIITAVLAAFGLWKLWKREFLPLFFGGWFLLLLAPVLPLANHMSEYYPTIPGIGLAWLAGWAMVAAWRNGWAARSAAVVLASAYAAGSIAEVNAITAWQMNVTAHMRVLIRAIEDTVGAHPGTALVLTGVNEDLFLAGLRDDPFRLMGVHEVWLAPGQDEILHRKDLDRLERFRTTTEELAPRLERGEVRELEISGATVRDTTTPYTAVVRALYADAHRNFVDAGDPLYASSLGAGWYGIENGARWTGKTAMLNIGGGPANSRLYVTGYAAPAALAGGPVTLRFSADGHAIGTAKVAEPGQAFADDFAMPASAGNEAAVRIAIECSRTFRPPGDVRELGMILRTFTVR